MVSKTLLIAAMIAYVEARFGQEQLPIDAISQVQGGEAGAAATIAGATISDLLGGANACAKLVRADQIVADLGGGQDAIDAAIGLVAAEKNTNPFAGGNVQNVCSDPALPATAELRGITPLIDPDVDADGAVNALSAQSVGAPLAADGLSVFDLLVAEGLGDLVAGQAADGAAAAAAGGDAAAAGDAQAEDAADANVDDAAAAAGDAADANADDAVAGDAQADDAAGANADDAANVDANVAGNAAAGNATGNANADAASGNSNADANADANADDAAAGDAAAGDAAAGDANADDAAAGNANADDAAAGDAAAGDAAAGGAAGADFGLCTPTIIFEGGQNNRPADEFTFQIADELARGGQGEALNPNIITNALCDQLGNVCEANEAAITTCLDAAAQVEAAGTRDKSTADLFNTAVGFDGAVTNPSGGPEDVPAAGAAAAAAAKNKRDARPCSAKFRGRAVRPAC
ncbi:hypothetical protein BDV95DRAFT_173038 [Massariosphaeria phaeospora]|uniref:Circumsporozoite protein n=1 Tax=Massariosphaeria phaeospora TaxID=100035 RepID=A0A7C8I0T0_9PLEO|nr:hypothetical protein BDV95DRAFT_173038 [Massariosphaeria phaeospora]